MPRWGWRSHSEKWNKDANVWLTNFIYIYLSLCVLSNSRVLNSARSMKGKRICLQILQGSIPTMALSHELICNFCAYWHERARLLFCASASFSVHYIYDDWGSFLPLDIHQQSELFCFAPRIISLLFNSARQMQFECKKHAHAYPCAHISHFAARWICVERFIWNAAAAATVVAAAAAATVVAAAFLFSQIEFDCCWLKACASCLMCLQRRKSGSEIAARHKTRTAQYSQPAARWERVWKYTGIESAFAPAKCQFFLRTCSLQCGGKDFIWVALQNAFSLSSHLESEFIHTKTTKQCPRAHQKVIFVCTLLVLNRQRCERVWEYTHLCGKQWRRVYRCKSPCKIGSARSKKALKLAGSARCPALFHLLLMCGGAGTCWRCESAVVKRLVISMQMLAQTGWH